MAVAGNVGTPVSSLAGDRRRATVVCEASSFQLEDSTAFAPEVAVFLNIAPDHLDRHGTLEEYLDAKLRIFANQEPATTSRSNVAKTCGLAGAIGGSAGRELALDGRRPSVARRAADRRRGPAAGRHNRHNAMAAAAAARSPAASIRARLAREFPGVPHRLEHVARSTASST